MHIPSDQDRLDAIGRFFRLSRPNDPTGEFTFSKNTHEREELAALIFDVAPLYLIRTAMLAPAGHRVIWRDDLEHAENNSD